MGDPFVPRNNGSPAEYADVYLHNLVAAVVRLVNGAVTPKKIGPYMVAGRSGVGTRVHVAGMTLDILAVRLPPGGARAPFGKITVNMGSAASPEDMVLEHDIFWKSPTETLAEFVARDIFRVIE